jgi:hypothetical protein
LRDLQLLHALSFILLLSLAACTGPSADDDDDDSEPSFEMLDDCFSEKNDSYETAFSLPAENRFEALAVRLCEGDVDYYQVSIPPGKWLSMKITIHGDGSGGDDLDLIEVNEDDAEVWGSFASQPFERIAWYNPSEEAMNRIVRVQGYNGANDDYDISLRLASYHEGLDCDSFYPDTADEDDGQCNRIMQFPQANTDDNGYWVNHQAHYSNLRREVAYLVRYAAEEVARQYPDTGPLGLLDMSQWDGDTPGRMDGQLRHPEGTHVEGNDIDIAYYMNSGNNLGGYACSSHDQYFCNGEANLMDTERTTYFLAKLLESPNVRVIGIDPAVADKVLPMAWEMEDDGLISQSIRSLFQSRLAYGEGWPFHHHHLHFSWNWESGFEGRDAQPEGCLDPNSPDYVAAAIEADRLSIEPVEAAGR